MTLSKLAKLANVSVSTASKAFAGSTEVNEETRQMIFEIAKQYGCFKKFYNAKYPKWVIAIIAPEFTSAYYVQYLSLIREYLDPEKYELCVSTTGFSAEREAALIEYYDRHTNVDGIILIQSAVPATEWSERPVVFINPAHEQAHGVSVYGELMPALRESVGYLTAHGVDAIGFIGESLTDSKRDLFRQALSERGVPYDESLVSISEKRFEEGGYQAMSALLAADRRPRAVICAYDDMAIGAMRCMADHGLSVPRDIAVLGMDDIPQAPYLNPPLASISSNVKELCRLATESIVQQIQGEDVAPRHMIPSTCFLRQSFAIGHEEETT